MGSETGIVYVCPAADGSVRELRERVGRVTTVDAVAERPTVFSSADCVVVGDGSPDADPVERCRRLRDQWPDRPLATVRYHDEDRERLEPAAVSETLDEVSGEIAALGSGDGILWRAYEDGEPAIVENAWTERLPYDVGTTVFQPLGNHGVLTVASVGDADLDPAEIHLVHVLAATAEAALDRAARERELERTQTIVETVGDCVYQLDAEGRFVTVNDTMAKTCDYDRDELVGEHISTVLTDESVERGQRHVRRLRSNDRRIATYEVTLVGRDGERTPAEVNMALLRSDGEIVGSAGIARDISERKRMERELVERKAKIERLHEIASRLENYRSRREIYDCAVEAAEDVLNLDVCAVKRLEGEHLVTVALSSKLDAEFDRRTGIAGKTYRTGETYRIDDLRTAPDAGRRHAALGVVRPDRRSRRRSATGATTGCSRCRSPTTGPECPTRSGSCSRATGRSRNCATPAGSASGSSTSSSRRPAASCPSTRTSREAPSSRSRFRAPTRSWCDRPATRRLPATNGVVSEREIAGRRRRRRLSESAAG